MSEGHSTVEYREVAGFPEYRVGNDGSLWTRWVRGRFKRVGEDWRRIRGNKAHGHPFITLHGERGAVRREYIHRLILEAFVGPCPAGMEACHRDDVRTNNALGNLRWDTSTGNKADMVRNGKSNRGERHPLAKLDEARVLLIRERLKAGHKQKDIARDLNVKRQTVGDVHRGRRWGWLKGG